MKFGYLVVSDTRPQKKRHEPSKVYSLTWKGFVVSLTFNSVRSDVISVLRKNPLLTFPVKSDTLDFIESSFSSILIEKVSALFLNSLLDVLPPNVDIISNEAMVSFFQHAIFNMNREKMKALFSEEKLEDEKVKTFIARSDWMGKIERFRLVMAENIHRQIQAFEELKAVVNEIKESIA